ncbi:flagellar basal-body MS-ring/collar protein FliF [Armatimonas sp.]|uniref:flagellar basal-body MS-ring/collar protein FliF n=1 Tax=Armatimonas sp. TaxID=1872638 RepID=UPI00286AD58D|nr:flagellar basal-body MS-ring/collar protein FliF [Armatimonas sp.]
MLNSLKNNWSALSNLQKAGLAAILVAVFGGILALAITSSRPTYGVLYSKLSMEDASAIKTKLQERNISFKLESDRRGEIIQIPADQVTGTRLDLAGMDLPKGHADIGDGIFDQNKFGMTDAVQKINKRRANEGELNRTIKSLEGVDDAIVHIAMPDKTAFSEPTDDVKASVTIHMLEGYQLSAKQVTGIVKLIASSVERLTPDKVTVLDSKGNSLNSPGEGENIGRDQIDMEERYERRLTDDLQRLADRALGPSRAEIIVRTELDWDQSQLLRETYKPSGPNGGNLPTNETKSSEVYTKQEKDAPTAPGTMTNLVTNNKNQVGDYNRINNTNTYAVDKLNEKRTMAQGKIKHLSVAILLDEAANIAPIKQTELRNTLAAAAGLDLNPTTAGGRGDQISLTVLAFNRADEEKAKADSLAATKQETQMALIRNGAALAALVLVAIFTMIMMRPRHPKKQKLDATLDDTDNPALPSGRKNARGIAGAPAGLNEDGQPNNRADGGINEIPLDEDELATPLGRIRRVATNQPEDVAAMLQDWLREQPISRH